jgi:hypothetical protein
MPNQVGEMIYVRAEMFPSTVPEPPNEHVQWHERWLGRRDVADSLGAAG